MSPAAGRPSEPGRSLWHPQQSYVAEETGQSENSLSATTRHFENAMRRHRNRASQRVALRSFTNDAAPWLIVILVCLFGCERSKYIEAGEADYPALNSNPTKVIELTVVV